VVLGFDVPLGSFENFPQVCDSRMARQAPVLFGRNIGIDLAVLPQMSENQVTLGCF
jgi:hypothetical protein